MVKGATSAGQPPAPSQVYTLLNTLQKKRKDCTKPCIDLESNSQTVYRAFKNFLRKFEAIVSQVKRRVKVKYGWFYNNFFSANLSVCVFTKPLLFQKVITIIRL